MVGMAANDCPFVIETTDNVCLVFNANLLEPLPANLKQRVM